MMNVDKTAAKLTVSLAEVETARTTGCAEMSDTGAPSSLIALEGVDGDTPQRTLPILIGCKDFVGAKGWRCVCGNHANIARKRRNAVWNAYLLTDVYVRRPKCVFGREKDVAMRIEQGCGKAFERVIPVASFPVTTLNGGNTPRLNESWSLTSVLCRFFVSVHGRREKTPPTSSTAAEWA